MRRDLDLTREILMKLEAYPLRYGSVVHIEIGDQNFEFPDQNSDVVAYHLNLVQVSGFIDQGGLRPMVGIGFRGLTPEGHDYLDAVRDPEVWRKTKGRAEKAGGWTLGLVKEIGLAVIKGELQKHGVPIG